MLGSLGTKSETPQHWGDISNSAKTESEPLEMMLDVGSQVQRMSLLLDSSPRVGGVILDRVTTVRQGVQKLLILRSRSSGHTGHVRDRAA